MKTCKNFWQLGDEQWSIFRVKLDTDIHNSDRIISIFLWIMWAQVCNNLWFIPGHSKMKIWQNAFNLYFDKRKKRRSLNYKRTPLRQLITSHWTFGQHSKCLQKIFKENRARWITRAQACEPSALPLWAGRCPFCTTMQYFCSNFALLYFGPFFADLQRQNQQRGPRP